MCEVRVFEFVFDDNGEKTEDGPRIVYDLELVGGGGSQQQGLGGIGKIIVDEEIEPPRGMFGIDPIEYRKNLGCAHSWVDVGFMQSKIVCKHCNKEQI